MTIVCLLPARNAAHDLPGFFASASLFADAVVALDDGSTDRTREMLAAHPLVKRLLVHPIRPDYRGWNDAANRNALLRAAADLMPEWIVSIDADERLDPSDAAALRDFVATDALPGIAYGLRCYSMQRDLVHYLPNPIWVYRLFAYAPGQRFPDRALHFAPVPTTIPRRAFVQTSLRLQHLGGITPERSRERYEKYRQTDPECRYWPDYRALLRQPEPASLRVWRARPPAMPAIDPAPFADDLEAVVQRDDPQEADVAHPLSVVILGGGPRTALERTIGSVLGQSSEEAVEVILAARSCDREGIALGRRHPGVRLVEAPPEALPGALRNAGLRAATGDAILFLDADLSLAPGALAALIAAHRDDFALVAPVVQDCATGRSAAAVYATGYRRDRPGRAAGVSERAPRLCSYRRSLLSQTGGFPEDVGAGEEIVVNTALAGFGYLTFRQPAATLRFHGDGISPPNLVARAFRRGRATARAHLDTHRDRGELLQRRFAGRRPSLSESRRNRRGTARASHGGGVLVVAAASASWLGEWIEVMRPRPGKALVLTARPAGLLLACLTEAGVARGIALIRFDLPARRATVVPLPPNLLVEAIDGRPMRLDDALGIGTRPVESGALSRFAVQDTVGRTFALALDDFIALDAPSILGAGPLPTSVENWLRRIRASQTLANAVRALRYPIGIRSNLTRWTLLLAFLRLRSFEAASIAVRGVETSPAADETVTVDQAAVALARSALGAGERAAHPTRRDRLKQVEWA